jgi:hypothetical protein
VPALILSGGEPLLRKDIFEIAAGAKALGFYRAVHQRHPDRRAARPSIADVGLRLRRHQPRRLEATHDRFRRQQGAFGRPSHALRLCRDLGIKVGVRFTLTQDNYAHLPAASRPGGGRAHRPLLPLAPQLRAAAATSTQAATPGTSMTREAMTSSSTTACGAARAAWSASSSPATTTPTAPTC